MIRDNAEGLPLERRSEAANEEFTGTVTRRDTPGRERGWDPYEVWQTRVRAPSEAPRAGKDRPREPQV